jgi:uncharacterized protein (TIGR02145 family)
MKKIIVLFVSVFLLLGVVIINSCKKESTIPTLTTTAQSNVTINSATSGGVITKDGGEAITARGVCWSTSQNATVTGSHTTDGTGSGSFTSSLTDLAANTLYYARAYATNSVGTAYGNEISFTTSQILVATLTTTAITSIAQTTAVSGGTISADGGGAITARGVCWATTTGPTTASSKTSDATGTGAFTSNISGLLPGTLYYVRAYATNSAGTAYGNELSFTTNALVGATLTTTAATSITLTTAVSGGNITSDGGTAVTAKGVCWATTANPTTALTTKTSDGTGTGTFTSNITGLLPGVTYHVRAYAVNSVTTAYGNDLTFTTSPVVVPTLTTTAAAPITQTTTVSGGNITADGGAAVTARGTCWSTSANPTITDSKTSDATGTGIFTSNITGLTPGTLYHARAYATNSAGTAYGNDITFTTNPVVAPVVTTTAATSIALTTAVAGGNVTDAGGGTVTVRGTCWSTSANPTITDSKTSDGTGTGVFVSNLTGLVQGTLYHIRAYATNSAGTSYGSDLTFTTSLVSVPTLTTAAVTSITLTTAVSGGNITADGGGAVISRGVCWTTTANPTISNSKTIDGSGTGVFVSNMTSLLPGTIYHVRAYAVNSAGTAYGNDVTFTTNSVVIPTLTTTTISAITATTAVSGGNITADGGAAVTARGICWATTTSPTILNSTTTNGTGTGIFASNMTALSPGTTYYVRSYATNSAGTAYGNELSFTTSAAVPTLTTTAVSGITLSTATSGGNITADGGGAVTARGVCWATTTGPTILNSVTTNGTGTGIFVSSLTGLVAGTTYYIRAYATNTSGTGYGNELVFRTSNETGTLNDNDGNTYATVKIGTQWWMAENLKTTMLNDNTPIPNITNNNAWAALSIPALCWYNNDAGTYKPLYGAMYNWFTVNTGNLCPTGWHVPTDADWKIMESFIGMAPAQVDLWGWRGTDQGTQLKNTSGWSSSGNGTNTSGFTALPGGYRYAADGSYNNVTELTYWWTASQDVDAITSSWYRRMDYNNTGVYRASTQMRAGKYVRCVQD